MKAPRRVSAIAPRMRGRRSLRTRLVVMVTLLLTSVALALLAFLPARIESRSRGLVEARAMGIATLLANTIGPALEFDDESNAVERLGQLASTPDAIYAGVARADGSVLASWHAPNGPPLPLAKPVAGAPTIDGSVLHVVVSITTKGGTHGFLLAGFTLEELEREKAAAFRLVAITSIIVVVVGLALAFFVGTLLIRPIERMTQLALRISKGESPKPEALDIDRDDEVGTMARAFALMLDGLDRHRSFLECQSEASVDGILIVSEQRTVISCNQRFVQIWGFPDDQLPTRDASKLLAMVAKRTAWPSQFVEHAAQLHANPTAESTDELRLEDGRIFERHSAPITSTDGTYFGRGWYFRDITDRRCAEDQIRALNTDLEQRVEERTHALELANQELATRLQQLGETQQKLLEASRKSGMADVATAVLHNVGNALNSVNVSAGVVLEQHRASKVKGLRRVADLVAANKHDLAGFLATDRGKRLPEYLDALVETLDSERSAVTDELMSLQNNIDHIKAIVAAQQGHARHGGVIEQIAIDSLLEDALTLHKGTHETQGISIERDYAASPTISCDRHKLLQIVMNFLSNASYAVTGNPIGERRVIMRTRTADDASMIIEVEDNGVGIDPEHLKKIFTFGFTTKPSGHGFGLHSSACCAIELGGTVAVDSDGVGKGARFRLAIPIQAR
jgi:signal transduction histidine kinase/HAMP domain-containing protein